MWISYERRRIYKHNVDIFCEYIEYKTWCKHINVDTKPHICPTCGGNGAGSDGGGGKTGTPCA